MLQLQLHFLSFQNKKKINISNFFKNVLLYHFVDLFKINFVIVSIEYSIPCSSEECLPNLLAISSSSPSATKSQLKP